MDRRRDRRLERGGGSLCGLRLTAGRLGPGFLGQPAGRSYRLRVEFFIQAFYGQIKLGFETADFFGVGIEIAGVCEPLE